MFWATEVAAVRNNIEIRCSQRHLRLLVHTGKLRPVALLIIDGLGYVPLSQTGAELPSEVFSQQYERGSTIVTSNLPFECPCERWSLAQTSSRNRQLKQRLHGGSDVVVGGDAEIQARRRTAFHIGSQAGLIRTDIGVVP
jgi:DNA replication protein DnaC